MKTHHEMILRTDKARIWTRWTLEAASWAICLGLLAASVAVSGLSGLIWLLSGSTVLLAIGLLAGLLLGLVGVWHMLLRMDQMARKLAQ